MLEQKPKDANPTHKQIEHELAELRKALDARPTSWQLFWVIVLAGIAISAVSEIMRGLAP